MREHLATRSTKIVWFDPESPIFIVNALEEMLMNYDEYKKSAMSGRNNARPSWHDIARQYIQVFNTTLGKNRQ